MNSFSSLKSTFIWRACIKFRILWISAHVLLSKSLRQYWIWQYRISVLPHMASKFVRLMLNYMINHNLNTGLEMGIPAFVPYIWVYIIIPVAQTISLVSVIRSWNNCWHCYHYYFLVNQCCLNCRQTENGLLVWS